MRDKEMKLVGNTAIVTGGVAGIGYAITDALMTYGASVAIFDVKEEAGIAAAKKLNEEHKGSGVKAIFIKVDVTNFDSVKAGVDKTIKELGSVWMVSGNAGIDGEHVDAWDVDDKTWNAIFDVDVKGVWHLMKAVIPYWIENKMEGSIVNTSSINYCCPVGGLSHYSAAKAAVVTLSKVVASEAGRYGIRCNCIAPGLTVTDMTRRFAEGPAVKPFYERTPLFEHSDRARLAEPEDMAKAQVFLHSNYAEWITGFTINVDGGNHIQGLHNYTDWDIWAETGSFPRVEW